MSSWPARIAVGAAVLGAFMLLQGRRPRKAPAPVTSNLRRVLLVGDSLAVGLRGPLGRDFAARSIQLTGLGQTGTNARQWKNLISQHLGAERDLVLVSLGSNDAVSDTLRAEFGQNIIELCQKVRDAGARCVLLVPPNDLGGMIPIPHVEVIIAPRVELQPDGIHPTVRGYNDWADYLNQVIR